MAKKKKTLKPIVLDTAFFTGGLVFGELIAYLVRDIGFLKWLSFQVSGTLDLVLISISIHLNPAVVLFPLFGVVGGRLLKKSLSEKKRTFADLDEEMEEENEEFDNDFDQDI